MKLGLFAATLVLVAGGAAGCSDDGGDGGSASDAPSTKEFCGALTDFQKDFSAADPTKDVGEYIKALKAAAEKLEGVGTPEDMPADAQDGFEITIDKINGLEEDATIEELTSIGEVSDEDQKKIDALDTYISEECPDLGGEPESSESP
jgi:hypothetical protein